MMILQDTLHGSLIMSVMEGNRSTVGERDAGWTDNKMDKVLRKKSAEDRSGGNAKIGADHWRAALWMTSCIYITSRGDMQKS